MTEPSKPDAEAPAAPNPRPWKAHTQITDTGKSALKRYQAVIVGSTSLWFTLKYEIICWLGNAFPEAIGLWLRKQLYPLLLRRVGRGVVFGSKLILRHPTKIELGDNVVIADHCTLDGRGDENAGITIGEGTVLGERCMVRCKNGRVIIGKSVGVGACAMLCAVDGNKLEIGDDALIGPYVYLDGTQYRHGRLDVPIHAQGLDTKGGITIGANTFVGAHTLVTDGVSIGSGSIIGAGSIVRENIPDLVVVTPHQKLVLLKRQATAQ